MRNTIVVPCIVNSSLYCAGGEHACRWRSTSCSRISSASMPPMTKKTSAVRAVHDADLLVVDGGEPAPEAGRRRGPPQEHRRACGRCLSACRRPWSSARPWTARRGITSATGGSRRASRPRPGSSPVALRRVLRERRHAHARRIAGGGSRQSSDCIGIMPGAFEDPVDQVVARQLVVPARERGAAREVGEVRAVVASLESSVMWQFVHWNFFDEQLLCRSRGVDPSLS